MHWIMLTILSALFLGVYDITKKAAVRDNAVPAVLLLNVLTAALLWFPLIVLSALQFDVGAFQVHALDAYQHGLLAVKSLLVGASWTLAFFALKHLPISVASPIRATSPLWTLMCALAFFGEQPTVRQLWGIAVVLTAFFFFGRAGRREGIHFASNRWVGFMMLATILGSASALYDKLILQVIAIPPETVQAWFSVYLVPVMLPLAAYWYCFERKTKPFEWRWTIPLIAITLLVTDYCYFYAVSDPDALISLVSPIRRTSVIIPFLAGVWWLSEKNWRQKLICILAMLVGVCLISV